VMYKSDMDLRVGRQLEAGRQSESNIYNEKIDKLENTL
jgi:hypothetical protein